MAEPTSSARERLWIEPPVFPQLGLGPTTPGMVAPTKSRCRASFCDSLAPSFVHPSATLDLDAALVVISFMEPNEIVLVGPLLCKAASKCFGQGSDSRTVQLTRPVRSCPLLASLMVPTAPVGTPAFCLRSHSYLLFKCSSHLFLSLAD